ncbi:MAG: efflux RND transporter periplasmic adaptor subunit [Nitrospirae bacterium]|nr:efflux RND transporter periplasmic adaptor subunit [Nitrospirota bacterium]
MKNFILVVAIVIAILIIIIAGGYLVSGHADEKTNKRDAIHGFRIETSRPSKKDFKLSVNCYGSVVSQNVVAIRAPLQGRIVKINVAEESSVKKGDILFIMGGPDIERKLQILNFQASHLGELISELKGVLQRKKDALHKRLISIDELEAAKLNLLKTRRVYDETLLRLHQLQDSLKIRAPFDGVFTKRIFIEGQDVDKGEIIGYIIDTQHLRVIATAFPLKEDREIKGKEAVIFTRDGNSVHGTVKKVLTERTPSGGVNLYVESKDIDRQLRVGESVSGIVILRTDSKVISLPERAVVYDDRGNTFVFIKSRGGQYIKRSVHVGLSSDGWVEILNGVSEVDEVVTQGAYELFYRDFNRTFRVED